MNQSEITPGYRASKEVNQTGLSWSPASHGLPCRKNGKRKALATSLLVCLVAISASGCASLGFDPQQDEGQKTTQMDRFDQILDSHAGKVASAWVRLADVRESLKRSDASDRQQKLAKSIAVLDSIAPPTVFSGDIEEFLKFLVVDMKGWSVAVAEGRKMSVSHTVNVRSSGESTYRDVLIDASHQLSGQLEIVVNPSAQSLRVRYPAN